jgi:thiol-disulfide isomerase/thioredoxin
MLFNSPNVIYLEQSEFDSNLNLSSPLLNRYSGQPLLSGLTIVMIQGNYCGYCTKMKPMYQQVADELVSSGIDFATIQIDGTQRGEEIFGNSEFLSPLLGKPLD